MLKTVRLELGRNPGFPEGSGSHGYEIRVPLDEGSHIELAQWKLHRQDCSVRRFWGSERDLHGSLIHGRHGWAVSYAPGEDDDERIYRLDRHVFRVGEYVSIIEPNGASYTFRVASVR